MALTQLQTDLYPVLQREIAAHWPATSIATVLAILQRAEMGDLIAQAELFSDMEERDAHIYAELNKRRMAVAQLDWDLKPVAGAGARETRAVNDLKARLEDSIDMETTIFDLTSAIGHGFSCAEIEWAKGADGWWLPVNIHARPQRWFTVDIETRQQIRLRNNTRNGEELQAYGWISHRHSSKTGEPGTMGLFRVLALPYLFKNFATKNWLRFCELYAVPIRILMSNEQDESKRASLLAALRAMGQNGAALLSGALGEDLITVPAATGEGQGFEALITWCERSVSKAVLGGTLTSMADGKSSTNALGKVHDDIRFQIRNHDAKQIAATLTHQLIGAIIQVNRLSLNPPKLMFDTQEPEDLSLYADALPKLAGAGLKIPIAWAHEKLRIPLPEGNEPFMGLAPTPTQIAPASQPVPMAALAYRPAGASYPDQAALDIAIDALASADAANQAMAEALLKPVFQLIQGATSYQDILSGLAAAYPDMNTAQLEDRLARALFAADAWGQINSAKP